MCPKSWPGGIGKAPSMAPRSLAPDEVASPKADAWEADSCWAETTGTLSHTHIERFWLPSRFYVYQFTILPKCHHRVSQGTDGEGVSEPGFKDFAASCRKHGYETFILDIHLTFWTICKYPDFGLGAGSPVPASTGAASSHRDRFLESSNTGSRDDSWYCV